MDYFAELDNPSRCYGNKHHELSDVLVLTILAVISGVESWVEIEGFGILMTRLDLFSLSIKPRTLRTVFLNWIKSLIKITEKEAIAIDGKTVRRSYDGENRAIHLSSAWATHNSLAQGQTKTADKPNEITAIPVLLQMIEVASCTVTTDTMGCLREIRDKTTCEQLYYLTSLPANTRSKLWRFASP